MSRMGGGLVKLFYESNIEIDEVDLEKCMEVFFDSIEQNVDRLIFEYHLDELK